VPTASVEVANVASPEEFKVAAGSAVPSTVKITLPVGVVSPDSGATSAVNVTVVPTDAGFALEASVVAVEIRPDALNLVMNAFGES
jgi:hypothetical protein